MRVCISSGTSTDVFLVYHWYSVVCAVALFAVQTSPIPVQEERHELGFALSRWDRSHLQKPTYTNWSTSSSPKGYNKCV